MRTLFITGINRGLGHHLAQQALERGGRVAGTARNLSDLQDLKAKYGERLFLANLDLTDFAAIRSTLAQAFQVFEGIDAIVSNAASRSQAPLPTPDFQDYPSTVRPNGASRASMRLYGQR